MEEVVEFVLGPEVTIKNVRQVSDRISEILLAGRDLSIRAADLESGDVTLVQILIAARKSAAERGCRVCVEDPSPALTALLRRCGLAAL
ncbi:hypothetical protein KL86APRO_20500 [uncultured Alphaproteobacteria bacterium]|uniref:STAS domain-containing protein n=1 Tax=uncultured Alphaproteobacteria bacterium TaxID=91750 RepID=A0A212KKK9_9PROT|nr:hypothetical protein KL86APRO_20500 [uncultured Alphaproteobacteria bacterium]